MTDRELRLEQALTEILQWSMAYPMTVFLNLPEDKLEDARQALKSVDIDMGALHAQWARHLVSGIGKIAKEALEDTAQ